MAGLRLVPLADVDAPARARVEEIYADAFPPGIGSPFATLLVDRVLVLLDPDGRARGLTVTRDLGDTGWVFLRYFAVGERGGGRGSELWRLLCEAHRGRTRILLDVEDPAEPGLDDAEADIRPRRIRFYERLGVVELPVEDYHPPHDDGAHALRLMLADLDATGRPAPTSLPGPDDLRDVVLAVFEHRYGLPAHHDDVRRCLLASGL